MKNKKSFLIILLVFVLLLVGAYVLYDRLGQTVEADQMIVHATQQPTDEPASPEETPEAEAAAEPEAPAEAEAPAEPEVPAETEPAAEQEPETILAPDFTVYDKAGSEVTLRQFFGKPIVLNFWASWCGPCQSEMPDFNEKYAELAGEVHFLMVNMTDGSRETVQTASAFIDKNGYTFPVFYDTSYDAARTYGAYSLPTTFFISAKGEVIAHAVGAINGQTLQRGIDMITE